MKRKNLNPVVIILNRNFNEVIEAIMFAVVIKSDTSIEFKTESNVEAVCSFIKDAPEDVEVSVYVKMPFTNNFISGNKVINAAMKKYFPEVAEVNVDEVVDEVATETIPVPVLELSIAEVDVITEVAPKRRKTKKKEVVETAE